MIRRAPPVLCCFVAVAAAAFTAPARASSAIAQIAPELVKSLGAVPSAPVVVASPVASDVPAPKGDELAVRVAQIVAGKFGGAARAHAKTESLAAARAAAGKAGALVYLHVEIAKGELRVTADLYPAMSNAWDRIRIGAPAPLAHGFAQAPLDAEVRAFLAPAMLEQAQLHRARHDEGEVLAAACGDLDGDGGMEIALVSRARVAVGSVRAGRFAVRKAAPWSALSPRAAVPLRESLAGAVLRGPGALLVGTTDRGGVQLDANLAPTASLAGIPVPSGRDGACAHANPEAGSFEGGPAPCAPADGAHAAVTSGTSGVSLVALAAAKRFDAFAGAEIVQRDGAPRTIEAMREPGGKLRVRVGEQIVTVDGVGAQLAVGDFDLDGAPEIATTADAGEDAVAVSTWTAAGLRPRAKLPAPPGVRALAVCPPEERGVSALVVVTGGEVWIWR